MLLYVNIYNENKVLKKEIIEGSRRWKEYLCVWISSIDIISVVILLKVMY